MVAYCHALLLEGSARCSFRLAMGPCRYCRRHKQQQQTQLYLVTEFGVTP